MLKLADLHKANIKIRETGAIRTAHAYSWDILTALDHLGIEYFTGDRPNVIDLIWVYTKADFDRLMDYTWADIMEAIKNDKR